MTDAAGGRSLEATVRSILAVQGRVPRADRLRDGDDLYLAGLTSHAAVAVMLALEEALGVEFPDQALSRETFASIGAIRRSVETLQTPAP